MPRYADERDYPDPRGVPQRREARDVRDDRERGPPSRGERRTTERDIRDDPMELRPDPRLDSRIDPRANAGVRREPAPERGPDVRGEPEVVYRDERTGQLYREPPRAYRDDRDDLQPPRRPIIDPARDRDQGRPEYNEYFLPGEGVDREVIQHEICRYLGQDATCRPGRHPDVRPPSFNASREELMVV